MTVRPKVLFCDVDRTLLTNGHELLPVVSQAIGKASQEGLQVILASARSPAGIAPLQRQLGLDGPAVCFNGAWVGQPEAGRPTQEVRLSLRTAHVIAHCAVDAGLAVMWYDVTTVYAPVVFAETARRQANVTGDQLVLVPSLDQLSVAPFKLMVVVPPDIIQNALVLLQSRCGSLASIMPSGPGLIEVVHKDVSKARGTTRLAADLGLTRDMCAAVGDGGNDLEMLRWAGLPLTVANGAKDVRALAQFIGGHCDTGGLADVIEWILQFPDNVSG